MFLEQVKIIILKCFQKIPEHITGNIEISSNSDREDSDEENSDEENSDKENFDEEN